MLFLVKQSKVKCSLQQWYSALSKPPRKKAFKSEKCNTAPQLKVKIPKLASSMKLSTKRRKKKENKLPVRRRSKYLFRRSEKGHSNVPTTTTTVWTTTEKYADFGMRWKRLYVLCSRLGHQARGPTLALLRSLPQRCHFNSVCHQVLRKFIGKVRFLDSFPDAVLVK